MRYKAGVLGVVVIMIAIAATLMGSWVMSMDVVEEKVTKYNELVDIVGEFDSQQTPTFTEYSPSTNYTGYFTDNSIIGEIRYFDGVDYTTSNPNNYRLNLMPTDVTSGTITVTDAQSTGHIEHYYLWTQELAGSRQYGPGFSSCTIAELIQSQGWTNNRITLVCPDPDYTALDSYGVVTFCSSKDVGAFRSGSVLMHEPGMTGDLKFVETKQGQVVVTAIYNASEVMTPVMAISCDLNSNTVILYADKEMTKPIGQGSPTDTYLIWSGKFYQSADMQYSLSTIPPATYMDPSAGVVML